MYAAIKINSQQEYKEAEKLLIEKGFKTSKRHGIDKHDKRYECFIIVYEDGEFYLHSHTGGNKVYENINEFLGTLTNH